LGNPFAAAAPFLARVASYKYASYLGVSDSAAFDRLHPCGADAPHAAIYRCEGCGREIASPKGSPLPEHPHPNFRPVLWRLAIYAHG
jgi:hypothetical protein